MLRLIISVSDLVCSMSHNMTSKKLGTNFSINYYSLRLTQRRQEDV